MINVLVIEDDEKLNKVLCKFLYERHFEVKGCLSAQDAYEAMEMKKFDFIISDIMMDKIDGFEFAESVREMDKNIPILFMTARDDFPAKQKGYQIGIDDYMVKPVNFQELLLHIDALLRRANIQSTKRIEIDGLVLDEEERSVLFREHEIEMTKREFDILYKMLSNPKKAFSRAHIMNEFWSMDDDATLRAVDVYIARIREKLSLCDVFEIVTIRGIGYKVVLK